MPTTAEHIRLSTCDACGEVVLLQSAQSMRRYCVGDATISHYEERAPQDDDRIDEVDVEICVEVDAPLLDAVEDESLEDFNHLMQFMSYGRCICSDAELQLVKFVQMAHGGYGVSRQFSEGMLEYCKASGGKNVHLPDSWRGCVDLTTSLIERLQGGRKTFTLDVPIPDNVRKLLADPAQTHIAFEFECPITEMIRIAMFSETCQCLDNVAFTYEENDGYLDDFCNGDRYKRIAADLRGGGAILGAILATDGICLDKCMFDSQEVCASLLHRIIRIGNRIGIGLESDWESDWNRIGNRIGIGLGIGLESDWDWESD
jgi:hypothetical protein